MPTGLSDERGGGGRNRKARRRPMRRHLYLVLDDWSSGYTIRKIDLLLDLDPVASCSSRQIITGGFLGKQRLPPPIMRVEAARGLPTHVVPSSSGGSSKLLFMQPTDDDDASTTKPTPLSTSFVPVVDVRLRSVSLLGPRPADDLVDPIYVPVGGGGGGDGDGWLFALDIRGAFTVLCPPPVDDTQESWSWRALPDPPFDRRHVVSYAALPDGAGLVVSTKANDDDDGSEASASFAFTMAGAEGNKPEWNRRHDMMMPFAGRGHFDPSLDAFVGLSGAPGSPGHLCLVYTDGSQKLSKEKLVGEGSLVEGQVKVFGPNSPVETQVGSTLVYMGGRSNFCLVQCFSFDPANGGGSGVVGEANGSKKMDADQDVSDDEMDIVGETTDDDDQDVSDDDEKDIVGKAMDDDQEGSRRRKLLFVSFNSILSQA